MRGICYWFYQHNVDDTRIRYCRHGSMCRFKHLTQQEVHTLQQPHRGEDKIQCPSCSGSGEMYIQHHDFHMTCLKCDGHKEITIKRLILDKCANREWCRCKNSPDSIYFPDGTHPKCAKHCYVCTVCKGITQTG